MLNRHYTKDGLTDLNYAAITVRMKEEGTNAGIYGLLLGYRTLISEDKTDHKETDSPFVWIYKEKCVYLYSLKYYEIESLEISAGSHGKTSQFTNFKGREDEAIKSILEIIKALKEQNKMQSNGLIDVHKYEALPVGLKSYLDATKQASTQQPVTKYTSGSSQNSAKNVMDLYKSKRNYTPTTYKTKENETFFIERTSKYPVSKALEKMKEKVEKIKNGTYQPPKLKKLSADKEKTVEKDDDANDDEDIYGYGHMGGI